MGKRFKDPIYGYINISSKIVNDIVDTAEFQRLRNVIQTSYAPLYSSAVHNRFVHSLGVYHLGEMVISTIETNMPDDIMGEDECARFFELFEIACLLHDVGHAPFSHTGEEFYLDSGDRTALHSEIIRLTADSDLEQEIAGRSYKAAAHELMSVIVALNSYNELFRSDEEKSFFARCIIGYPFFIQSDKKHSYLNCLISLLNSAVIDVDKLDYLIRDAYITGFDTISIDYERLLGNIKIRKCSGSSDGEYKVIYTRGALSVIENVVYAHDAERKWIQNHPVVQYEGFLLKNVIVALSEKYGKDALFSDMALSVEGVEIGQGFKVSLLCDADVLFLMKNLPENNYVREYFNRNERRHPLWKSESEYRALFDTCFNSQLYSVLDTMMQELFKYLNYINKSQVINEQALQACETDIQETTRLYEKVDNQDSVEGKNLKSTIAKKEEYKSWLNAFQEFAEEQEISFDFVILMQSQFNSGFAKTKFSELQIEFPELKSLSLFKDVTNVLTANESLRERFFYVFYKREQAMRKTDIDMFSLVDKLNNLAKKITMK